MAKHHLLQKVTHSTHYHNLKTYKLRKQKQDLYVVVAASNCIELHRVMPDGLAFQASYQVFANIARIEVLSASQREADYLWLLDEKGRYAVWTPQGFQYANNQTIQDPLPETYQQVVNDSSSDIFSGVNHTCDESEQKGHIFFAMGPKITILSYFIKKQGVFMSEVSCRSYTQSYKEIRFIGWVKAPMAEVGLLGIVVQKENGETLLEVYEIRYETEEWKMVWTVNKKNMLQFYSETNYQILLLTYDQVALYRYKQGPICCYRTGSNYGQGFSLGQGIYGQIGKQLILFSKERLTPINAYRFPDQSLFDEGGLKECVKVGELEGVGHVLCLRTHRSELYFLTIFNSQCRLRKVNEGLLVVESLGVFAARKEEFVIVGRCSRQEYGIFLAQKAQCAKLVQWQSISLKIDKIYSAVRGSYLILSIGPFNFVARLTKTNDYSIYFQLPDLQIVAIYDDILVTLDGIYQLDYQTQNYYKYVENQIILAQIIQENVYFLDQEGTIYRWNLQSKQKEKLCEHCQDDYCWGISTSQQMLICANTHNLTSLRLVTENETKWVSIKGHTIISSLATIAPPRKRAHSRFAENTAEELLIGYVDGTVHVQSMEGHILKVIKLRKVERIVFESISESQVLVKCTTRQYILKATAESVTISGIQLVQRISYIQQLVYLEKTKLFLALVPDKLRKDKSLLLQLSLTSENWKSSLEKLPLSFHSLPRVLTLEGTVYFAQCNSIGKFDIASAKTQLQSHQVMELSGFEKIGMGLLLSGTLSDQKQIIIIWSQSLQILSRCHLTLNEPVRSIKCLQESNQILVLSDCSVTLHQLQPSRQGIKLLFGSNVPSKGFQLDLCEQSQLLVLNDCNQFVSLYSYDAKMTLVCRYVGAYEIEGSAFVGQNLLVFDQKNQLMLLSCEKELNRYVLNKQWCIDLGQRVEAWCKQNDRIYIATAKLAIYCVGEIEKESFDEIKAYQSNIIHKHDLGFNYWQWRSPIKSDKFIDCAFLQLNSGQAPLAENQPPRKLAQLLRKNQAY